MPNGILGQSKKIQKKPKIAKRNTYVKFSKEKEAEILELLKQYKASLNDDERAKWTKDPDRNLILGAFIKQTIPLYVNLF